MDPILLGAEIVSAAQQLVEGRVEILFRSLEVAGVIVILPGLVFFFDAGDQVGHRIDLERLRTAASIGAQRRRGLLLRRIKGCRPHTAGACACAGGMNERFWALWQARVAPNTAEKNRQIRLRRKPHILKTYKPSGKPAYVFSSMRWYYRKIRWVNATEDTYEPVTLGTGGPYYPRTGGGCNGAMTAGAEGASS